MSRNTTKMASWWWYNIISKLWLTVLEGIQVSALAQEHRNYRSSYFQHAPWTEYERKPNRKSNVAQNTAENNLNTWSRWKHQVLPVKYLWIRPGASLLKTMLTEAFMLKVLVALLFNYILWILVLLHYFCTASFRIFATSLCCPIWYHKMNRMHEKVSWHQLSRRGIVGTTVISVGRVTCQ